MNNGSFSVFLFINYVVIKYNLLKSVALKQINSKMISSKCVHLNRLISYFLKFKQISKKLKFFFIKTF